MVADIESVSERSPRRCKIRTSSPTASFRIGRVIGQRFGAAAVKCLRPQRVGRQAMRNPGRRVWIGDERAAEGDQVGEAARDQAIGALGGVAAA